MEGSESTLLHRASISGRVDLARFLVGHGAGTVPRRAWGGRDSAEPTLSLNHVSDMGHVEVVRFLLLETARASGSDPAATTQHP